MIKIIYKVVLPLLLFSIISDPALAKTKDPVRSFEMELKKEGYISIEQAKTEFENQQKLKILIPKVPIKTTHSYGKTYKNELSLSWINYSGLSTTENFHLLIKPAKKDITYLPVNNSQKVQLKNGHSGYLFEDNYFMFAFIRNGIEYCYTLKKSNLSKTEFINIANTFK